MSISDVQFTAWLAQDNVTRILLVEPNYYDGASEKTAYLSNGIYVSHGSDTPAHMPYDDVIMSIPQFQSSLSDGLQGFTVPSWGDIEISNELFDKDIWLTYAWDGRPIKLLFGDSSWARSDFRVILQGTIAGPPQVASSASIKLSIRDKQWMLNVPIQTKVVGEPALVSGTTYKVSDSAVTSINSVWDNGILLTLTTHYTVNVGAGTFTLVSPAVGRVIAEFTDTATNSKGEVVPLCFGPCYNITPVSINTSLLKYQVHDGQINAITAVRDNGVPVGYTASLSTGTFVLTASPVGTITCDVQGAKPSGTYIFKAGDIMNHIITTRTSLTSGDIDSTSLSNFITLCSQTIGIYVKDRRNVLDVLDEIVSAIGAYYTFNRLGKMIFGRITAPSGTPTTYLTADDVTFGTLRVTKLTLPYATFRLAFRKNWTIQEQVAGSVSPSLYNIPHSIVMRNNQSIKSVNLLATEPDVKITDLTIESEAITETGRMLTLGGVTRKTYQAEFTTAPLTINLGDVVNLEHPRYNLSSGVLLLVVGIGESVISRKITLTLWG